MMARHVTLADATDLITWADRLDSQSGLPKLLRRLVLGSARSLRRVAFRADEGIQLGGWDGISVTETPHSFVPERIAGWELSTRKDTKAKADEDYENRLKKPEGIAPSETTFVFVTPRRWPGKQEWASARTAERNWRSVIVYDADDLETWLEATPAVHIWLSQLLGKRPEDAVDLGTYWADWSHVTRPPFTTQFLLAGREAAAEQILAQLRSGSPSFSMRAESPEEARAVLVAAISMLGEAEQEAYFARIAVVNAPAAWNRLAASDAPLILIPTFDDAPAISRAIRQGHRVVVPVGSTHPTTETTIEIPRLSTDDAQKALLEAGVGEDRAHELAVLGRRSLMALRRKLSFHPEVLRPIWAQPENAAELVAFLLAGGWNAAKQPDLEVVGSLAKLEPERAQERAIRWSREGDPPIRCVGNVWYLTSKEDAWGLLARALTRFDLERFEATVLAVLGATDPRFDLDAKERWSSFDRSTAETKYRFGSATIDAIPLNGRNYLDLVLLAPGVTVNTQSRADLSELDARGAILGERAGNIGYLLDGLPNTDDFRGGPLQVNTLDAIQEFEVIETGWKAELGGNSGGVVNVVTKTGSNDVSGSGYFFMRDDVLDASNIPGEPPPELSRYNYGVTLGAPLAAGRFTLFGSAERFDETRGAIFPEDIPGALRGSEDFSISPTTGVTRLLGRFVGDLNADNELSVHVSWGGESNRNTLLTPTSLPSAGVDDETDTLAMNVSLFSRLSERLFLDSAFGFRNQTLARNGELAAGQRATILFLDTGATFDVGPRFDEAATLGQTYWVLRETMSLFPSENHSAKVGGEITHQRANGENLTGLVGVIATTEEAFSRFGLDSFNILQGTGFLEPGSGSSRLRNTSIGLFAQDDWRIAEGVVLNLGLRYDYDTSFDDTNNLAPRLGMTWSPEPETVIRASWGIFYDRYRLGITQPIPELGGFGGTTLVEFDYPRLAADALLPFPGSLGVLQSFGDPFLLHRHFGIPLDAVLTSANVHELTGLDESAFLTELCAFVKGLGVPLLPFEFSPVTGFLSQNLSGGLDDLVTLQRPIRTPFNNTLAVGVERTLPSGWMLGASYVHREIRNILGVRVTNLAPESREVGIPLTTDRGALRRTYGPWYDGSLSALVVRAGKRLAGRGSVSASYTYTRSQDNLLNPNLGLGLGAQGGGAVPTDNPDLEVDRGNSDLTVPHRFVAYGLAVLPLDIWLSGVVEATSGIHFSAAGNLVDVDGDGIFSTRPPSTERNEFRGPSTFRVDLRLEKRFRWKNAAPSFLVEFFNLTIAVNARARQQPLHRRASNRGFWHDTRAVAGA